MSKPFIQIDFNFNVNMKHFKSFLKKLKIFLQYSATVGIHSKEGKQKVIRRYSTMSKKGKEVMRRAGKSHTMTVVKLAYQNEFGANIKIKPRYKTVSKKNNKQVHGVNVKVTYSTLEKYSALRGAKEQGYLLLDKSGKFVAYFKPESTIHIPKRPFIRNIITNPTTAMNSSINDVLEHTFIRGGYTARSAFKKIAGVVQQEMQNNVRNNGISNHLLTVRAKGKNSPLIDEQDRLSNAIKFKIYRGAFVKGTKANLEYIKQKNIKTIDSTLKAISQFSTINREIKDLGVTKVKVYKRSNPNFEFY